LRLVGCNHKIISLWGMLIESGNVLGTVLPGDVLQLAFVVNLTVLPVT